MDAEELTFANIKGQIVDDFEILEHFSSGAFSHVHLARHITTDNYCAAKIIDLSTQKEKTFSDLMREISVFMQVIHPNICTLYRLSIVNKLLIFFMEYGVNGTLLQYVNKTNGLQELEARRIFIQLFGLIRHIQLYHFLVHRDLKLENILLDANNNVKLVDFGFAGTFYNNTLRSFVGTPGYTPPEIIAGHEYSEKCDVWSLGVCLFTMMVGRLPFSAQSHDYSALVKEAQQLEMPLMFSKDLQNLLSQMLKPYVDDRPSLIQLQNHPWLRGLPHIPVTIAPKPIIFYRVNNMNDVIKFKRKVDHPDARCVEAACDILQIEKEALIKDLQVGKINNETATYFFMLYPLKTKPDITPFTKRLPPLIRGAKKKVLYKNETSEKFQKDAISRKLNALPEKKRNSSVVMSRLPKAPSEPILCVHRKMSHA